MAFALFTAVLTRGILFAGNIMPYFIIPSASRNEDAALLHPHFQNEDMIVPVAIVVMAEIPARPPGTYEITYAIIVTACTTAKMPVRM